MELSFPGSVDVKDQWVQYLVCIGACTNVIIKTSKTWDFTQSAKVLINYMIFLKQLNT